ncbi:hypothetical protein OROMI_000673 [Orobanche minor]
MVIFVILVLEAPLVSPTGNKSEGMPPTEAPNGLPPDSFPVLFQVYVEDNYLVRWGIFPAGSSEYISNTTAMNIITQLKDHRLQLPERIGSYQLVEWQIEPPQKHTWWQKHLVAVAAGALGTLIVSLVSIGMFMVWRLRQREHGTYEPVGAIVPEQELQTL